MELCSTCWCYKYNLSTPRSSSISTKLTINDITSPIKTILLNIDEKDFDEVVTYLATNAPSLSLINHSNELNIDITAKYINKFTAIEHILGKYPTYVAFGNDHNDIEMLQHAKVGYFVNNESMDVSILKIIKYPLY